MTILKPSIFFRQCILQYTLRSSFFNLFLYHLQAIPSMAGNVGNGPSGAAWDDAEVDGGSEHLGAPNFDAMLLD